MSEMHVVIFAPRFDELHDDRAAAARSRAAAFAAAGIRTTVVCPAVLPRPAIEFRGGLEIRRHFLPRHDDAALAVRAIAAAWEIERRVRVAAIECIDSATLVTACTVASRAGLLAAPIVHVRVSASSSAFDACADNLAAAVQTFASEFTDRTDASVVPHLAGGPPWAPPPCTGPAVIVPTVVGESTIKQIAAAFDDSGLSDSGWAYSHVGPGSRWITRSPAKPAAAGAECVAIVGSDPSVFPAVGVETIRWGALALVHASSPIAARVPDELRRLLMFDGPRSLVERLKHVAAASADQRRRWAAILRAAWTSKDNESALADCRSLWRSLHGRDVSADAPAIEALWRFLERSDSTSQLALEASR